MGISGGRHDMREIYIAKAVILLPLLPQPTFTTQHIEMHQGLFVRDIQSKIITKLAEEGDADSRAALKAASRVGPFHEEAMAKSFAVLRVNDLEDAIALLYKACNVGQYVQTVHIGSKLARSKSTRASSRSSSRFFPTRGGSSFTQSPS